MAALPRLRDILLGCLLAGLAGPAAALGGSLPTVPSGDRPGPPLLYDRAVDAPQLSVQAPFRAAPLLVSGTDAYRAGEFLYQDYLFDDRGADTVPGPGSRLGNGRSAASPTAGDIAYPTAERHGGNAADLVEFRMTLLADAIVYRVTLNTVRERETAVVGIGIDTDRSGGAPVQWPRGAGISSPGLDRFITAWGTGGEVTSFPSGSGAALPDDAVSIDTETNQMTIRVPRSMMEPGSSTWRYVAGTGLWSGDRWTPVPARAAPTETEAASGNPVQGAPAVFNLAFRFDEPTRQSGAPFTTVPGVGNWFEDKQALALSQRTSGDFHADVDFAKLAAGTTAASHGPGRVQARIFASRFEPHEGVRVGFPGFGTRLQPYVLVVPPSYAPDRPAGLTLALHSGTANYTQYAVNNPNMYRQFGDERQNLVLTPLGRDPDTVYSGIGEADVFEAWADVARQFSLDPDRVALTGYSVGGYGAYRLGVHHPDLFGRAFTAVGLPAVGFWIPPAPPTGGQLTNTNPLLENVRWVPYLNWAQAIDEIAPYPGPRAQQDRFNALGLRSQLSTFATGEHFTLALADEWSAVRDFLGEARVQRDVSRVDYAFMPAADAPEFGLRHDHAYWLSQLRARETRGDPQVAPARAEISARSLAFGEGEPVTRPFTSSFPGPPFPAVVDGTEWTSIPGIRAENALHLRLENLGSGVVSGDRARLRGDRVLTVKLASDGPARMRLALPLPSGTRAERVGAATSAPPPEVAVDREGATFAVPAGERTYRLIPSGAARRERDAGRRKPGPGANRNPERPARSGRDRAAQAGATSADPTDGDLPFTGLGLGGLVATGVGLLLGAAGLRSRGGTKQG